MLGLLLSAFVTILERGGPRGSANIRNGAEIESIMCGTQLPDGSRCTEVASVIKTQYAYDRKPLVGSNPDYSLRAIHYAAVCPSCGGRKIIEANRKVD